MTAPARSYPAYPRDDKRARLIPPCPYVDPVDTTPLPEPEPPEARPSIEWGMGRQGPGGSGRDGSVLDDPWTIGLRAFALAAASGGGYHPTALVGILAGVEARPGPLDIASMVAGAWDEATERAGADDPNHIVLTAWGQWLDLDWTSCLGTEVSLRLHETWLPGGERRGRWASLRIESDDPASVGRRAEAAEGAAGWGTAYGWDAAMERLIGACPRCRVRLSRDSEGGLRCKWCDLGLSGKRP